MNEEIVKLPIWKNCLEQMRREGMSYGSNWSSEYFEKALRCGRDSMQFTFEMLALRQQIEDDDGYYLRSLKNGALWEIPAAAEHEEIAKTFEQKMKRYAVRSIDIRASTLLNPNAQLSDSERKAMESSMEKAAVRLLLMSRQKSISDFVNEKAPRLLKK